MVPALGNDYYHRVLITLQLRGSTAVSNEEKRIKSTMFWGLSPVYSIRRLYVPASTQKGLLPAASTTGAVQVSPAPIIV
jgi:hypothetical protein